MADGTVYTKQVMNIVVATLVADFLRSEIIAGREKIPKLKIEMRKIRRAVINFTARSMTVQITSAEDRAYFVEEEARFNAMEDEIEFIEENKATLATLELAILHDNIEYMRVYIERKK